jgi:hypothetical protein
MTQTYNDALEWAAKWIEDTLRAGPETHVRTIEFGTNMAMTLRAAKLSGADLPRATAEDDAWLTEIESACNALLLDVYDLSIANAPISPEYARQTVDCIGHRVGQIRESVAAIRAPRATADTEKAAQLADDFARRLRSINNHATAAGVEVLAKEIRELTPRATGETTVEAALFELLKMFPPSSGWHSEISKARYLGEKSQRVYTRFDIHVTDFEKNDWTEYGPTLEAAMAGVRAATRTEGEGEKR